MNKYDDIEYFEDAAVSPIAAYRMVADPVDRAGTVIVPSNRVYVDGDDGNIEGTLWAPWGLNNLLPDDLAEKIRKCGVLNAGLEAKARIAIGKGMKPVLITGIEKNGTEQMEFIYDPEIEDWMEENDDYSNSLRAIKDAIGYGWTHGRLYLSNDMTAIAGYKTDDVVNCRMQKKQIASGLIENTFYSPAWRKMQYKEDNTNYKKIPMLQEGAELKDLQQRIKDGTKDKEYSIISRGDLNGMQYYPYPGWFSCYDWVSLSIMVPAMKIAMFNNQMSIKYLITISDKYFSRQDIKWVGYTATEKQQKFREKVAEINTHLVGNDKAYKSIGVGSYTDFSGKEVADIRIEVLDDKVKDGKLLPDSSASDKQILFSLMMNPAIMGANSFGGAEGGAGSGSDIREAYLVQIMLMEAERRMNSKGYNIIKRFNGWNKKYEGKNLQFRYPNLILTTLDTGGSMAPVNT